MGQTCTRLLGGGDDTRKVLLLGLDGAGKTTLLAALHQVPGSGGASARAASSPASSSAVPLGDMAVETLKRGGLELQLWDLRGGASLRPYWRHHFLGTHGVVFVIDAADQAKLPVVHEELAALASDDLLRGVPFLLLLNKRDAPGALAPDAVATALRFPALLAGHAYDVRGVSASRAAAGGAGLETLTAAIDALVSRIRSGQGQPPAAGGSAR